MKCFGLLAAAALMGLASPVSAADTISLGTPTGPLGNTHTYTSGALTVTASGFDASNNPTALYGKSAGANEVGLGLNNDPTGQHEIYYGKGFVQLDVSALLGLVSDISFKTNSTSDGEQWSIFGSNTSGSYTGSALQFGTNQSSASLLDLGKWNFYDFVSTSQSGGKNFLINSLSVTSAVPEPATWAMMLLGFGAMGVSLRRRRRVPALQIA